MVALSKRRSGDIKITKKLRKLNLKCHTGRKEHKEESSIGAIAKFKIFEGKEENSGRPVSCR